MKKGTINSSVIVLAGGDSSRMGLPKSWLELDNGITFLETIVSSFKQFGFDDIVVVLNAKYTKIEWVEELSKIKQYTTIIKNSNPEKGRLYSLQLGLNAIKNDTVFIHNVDNPFIENSVLKLLSNNVELNGITIPSFKEKGGHPVVINRKVKSEIINNYQNYETLKEVFTHFPKKYIEVNSSSILKNINTPQELEELRHELA
jgi:CTP:molybdopterin cytidylyltransferase MocA